MLGVGAAAAAIVPPSEIWPFRKIFLPATEVPYDMAFTVACNWGRVGDCVSIFLHGHATVHVITKVEVIDPILQAQRIYILAQKEIVPANSEEVSRYGRRTETSSQAAGGRIDIGFPFAGSRSEGSDSSGIYRPRWNPSRSDGSDGEDRPTLRGSVG